MAAQYLMYSPGMQHLLAWGGQQAGELMHKALNLAAQTPRLYEAAGSWHDAATDLRGSAADLRDDTKPLGQWKSSGASAFHDNYGRQLEHLDTMADSYEKAAATIAAVADRMAVTQEAFLASAHAAGESVRSLVASGAEPLTLGRAVTSAWASQANALLDQCSAYTDQVAATLSSLRA